MNFFRRLTADVPGELLAAQVAAAANSRTDSPTTEPAAWTPAPEYPDVWTALAAAGNPGVIDHTTAGPFLPAQAERDQP